MQQQTALPSRSDPVSYTTASNDVPLDLDTVECLDLHALKAAVFSDSPAEFLQLPVHKEDGDDDCNIGNKKQLSMPCHENSKMTWLSVLRLMLTFPCNELVVRNERHRDRSGKEYARPYSKIDWRATFQRWKATNGHTLPKKIKDFIRRHAYISLQNMKGEARSICVHRMEGVVDIDLVNAHPRIMLDLLQQNGFDCQHLEYYCDDKNRNNLIEDIAHCFDLPEGKEGRSAAKNLMGYMALYQYESWTFDSWNWKVAGSGATAGKQPIHSKSFQWLLEYLKGYIVEMKRGRKWLLERAEFKGLDSTTINGPRFVEIAKQQSLGKKASGKHPNTVGTALAYLLQTCEYEIVSAAIKCATNTSDNYFEDGEGRGTLMCPIHDGFLIRMPPSLTKLQLEGRLRCINDSKPSAFPSSKFIEKSIDKTHDLGDNCSPIDVAWTKEYGDQCRRMAEEGYDVRPHQFTNQAAPADTYSEKWAKPISFDKDGKGVRVVRSPTGSGKSHQNRWAVLSMLFGLVYNFVDMRYTLHNKVKKPDLRVLVISSRVALDQELYKRMDKALREETMGPIHDSLGFAYYKDFVNDGQGNDDNLEGLRAQPRLVIQVDSVHKLKGIHYDLVIIDEANNVLEQVAQAKHNVGSFTQLQRLVRDTDKVIIQDAFADEEVATFLSSVNRNDVKWIDNQYKPMAQHGDKAQMQVNFEWDSERGEDQIVADLQAGKKLFVASTNYANAKALEDLVIERVTNKALRIVFIKGDARLNGQTEKDWKTVMLDNLNAATSECDLFIVTPCVAIGNSIDHGLESGDISTDPEAIATAFDRAYLLVDPHSIGWRDVVQMANRVRYLKDQRISIILNSKAQEGGKPDPASEESGESKRDCDGRSGGVDFKDRRSFEGIMEKKLYTPVTREDVFHSMMNALRDPCTDVDKIPYVCSNLKGAAQVGMTRGIGTDIDCHVLDPSLCPSNGLVHVFAAQMAEKCNRHMFMLDQIESLFLYMGALVTHSQPKERKQFKTKKEGQEHRKKTTIRKAGMKRSIDELFEVSTSEYPSPEEEELIEKDERGMATLTHQQQRAKRRKVVQDAYGVDHAYWNGNVRDPAVAEAELRDQLEMATSTRESVDAAKALKAHNDSHPRWLTLYENRMNTFKLLQDFSNVSVHSNLHNVHNVGSAEGVTDIEAMLTLCKLKIGSLTPDAIPDPIKRGHEECLKWRLAQCSLRLLKMIGFDSPFDWAREIRHQDLGSVRWKDVNDVMRAYVEKFVYRGKANTLAALDKALKGWYSKQCKSMPTNILKVMNERFLNPLLGLRVMATEERAPEEKRLYHINGDTKKLFCILPPIEDTDTRIPFLRPQTVAIEPTFQL